MLGLRNIADPADVDASGHPQLSAEFNVRADPDLIFLTDTKCCAQSPETVRERDGRARLKAVRTGNATRSPPLTCSALPAERGWANGRPRSSAGWSRVPDAPGVLPARPSRRKVDSIVVVNTGDGKGKSTAAFGTMLRAVAHGWPGAVVQFLKSGKWNVGDGWMPTRRPVRSPRGARRSTSSSPAGTRPHRSSRLRTPSPRCGR